MALSAASSIEQRASLLATLHPAYFALIMATGIVSIAAHLLGMTWLARPMFALNIAFYVVVWTLTIVRIVRHRAEVVADLLHHGRSVGFFTVVAATCVLGSQTLLIGGSHRGATVLWLFGVVLWALATYGIFTLLVVKTHKPTLAEGINGGWLVSVVAGQSVAVLGAQVAPGFTQLSADVLLFCLAMWLGAGMLYFWIISLVFYRYTFFALSPSELAPPYWINMGAAAITTLAGTMLVGAAPHSSLLQQVLPFVRGYTLFWWATATWWIPMLVILGVWRHLFRRFPLRYDPLYWGAVFPLGMYTACTFRLSQTVDAEALALIPRVSIYIAIAAWIITLVGMMRAVIRALWR